VATSQSLRLGLVEPVDAVAAFARRGLLQPTYRWQDVFQEEHARMFAVAGVQRLDVLQVFQDGIGEQLAAGGDLRAFAKAVKPQLVAKGFWGDVEVTDPVTKESRVTKFDDSRLQLIFDVNTRQSFAAGSWARIMRNAVRKPFLMYRTMEDERVRASHRPWDGVVLPVENQFWETHYPPNGWRCRCTVIPVNEQDLVRLGKAGIVVKRDEPAVDEIPYVNPRTGEVVPVPRGIDPGFAYNPGKSRDAALYEQALRKAADAHPIAGAVAVAQASAANPAMLAQTTARFAQYVDDVLGAASAPQPNLFYVGAVRPAAVRALQDAGMPLDSAALVVTDDAVRQALHETALDPQLYKDLPRLVATGAEALLHDTANDVLLYVMNAGDAAQDTKLVVEVAQPVAPTVGAQDPRRRPAANTIRSAAVMGVQALRDRIKYLLVWGQV
jgi:SPP1 gp7 family putative phage head morphogenesis protein